jgi:hypothetical protein
MALSKGAKIAIGIATIGVIGTASYFLYQTIKKRREEKNDTPPPPPPPPSSEGSGNDNSNDKTPFKNKVQGDLFRIWLNRYYPNYSQEIDLDATGEFDNTTIRKAFGKYGELYKSQNKNWSKATGNAIPSNLLSIWQNYPTKGLITNNSEGKVILLTSLLGSINKNDVYAYYYGNGKVNFTKGSKRILNQVQWWENGKYIQVGTKQFNGSNYYDTAYNVFQVLEDGFDAKLPIGGIIPTYSFNGNLSQDIDAPSRKGLGFDLNIID